MKRKLKGPRAQVLDDAAAAVNGERQLNYGQPEDNFLRIARLWNSHLKNVGIIKEGDRLLSNADVALMMILMKGGRLANTINHPESWTDIAGYAACGNETAQNIATD